MIKPRSLIHRGLQSYFSFRRMMWRVTQPLTLGCRMIIARDHQVCLVRVSYHKGWFLPGGGVERGETYLAAAIREAREETGVEVTRARLQGVYLSRFEGKIDHVAVFVAEDFSGEPRVTDPLEIEEVRYFPLDDLPGDLWSGHRRRLDEFQGVKPVTETW